MTDQTPSDTNTSNTNSIPSTPSWMSDQRIQRRRNGRGYGRRSSGIGIGGGGGGDRSGGDRGILSRSTVTKNQDKRRARPSALFGSGTRGRASAGGSMLNFDEMGEEALGGNSSPMNAEADEEEEELLNSAHARLQGHGRLRMRGSLRNHHSGTSPSSGGSGTAVKSLDQSAHARLESILDTSISSRSASGSLGSSISGRPFSRGSNSSCSNSGSAGLDLINDFDQHNNNSNVVMSKPKKKRPNLPRPPRGAARGTAQGSTAMPTVSTMTTSFATPKATDAFDFESEPINNGNAGSSSNSLGGTTFSSSSSATSGSMDNPISLLDDTTPMKQVIDSSKVTAGGGDAKRSKIATSHRPCRGYRRSNSTASVMTRSSSTSAMTARSTPSLFEENVHPNDAIEVIDEVIDSGKDDYLSSRRRSSRLQKVARRTSVSGLSSRVGINGSSNAEASATAVNTRSRAKANSKKRSATSANSDDTTNGFTIPSDQDLEQHQPSPPQIATTRSASMASFSSGSCSGSNSSTLRTSTSASSGTAGGSESFSSIARRSSDHNWAAATNNTTAGLGPNGTAIKKKSYHPPPAHKRSVSAAPFSTNERNSDSDAHCYQPAHKRSVSEAQHSLFSNRNSISAAVMNTPSASSIMGASMSNASPPSFLSPPFEEGRERLLSTPSINSTPSRKRRTMDFDDSSSPFNDNDALGGAERCRSRKVPPLPFMSSQKERQSHHQSPISEFEPTSSLITSLSEPITSAPMVVMGGSGGSIFSPPLKASSSFDKSLDNEMSFLSPDEKKSEDIRDRLSSDNDDESMMSTENDCDDSNSTSSSTTSEEEDEEDGTPREMTDGEIFQSKSSYDDFKFLIKSLQKWSQSSNGKGASMGLNNGCLIAVPPSWDFEHRANFAKWVATAFRFRVGNVGGTGCGSFLRCSDSEGNEVLAKLRHILNDFKADRLVLPSTGAEESNAVARKKSEQSRNETRPPRQMKPKSKLPIKLSSTRRSSLSLGNGPLLSMSPFGDDFVGDLLADDMKGIALEDKKPKASPSVPNFIRSMTIQPLANRIKNTTLPCFRSSPTLESGRRSNGGGRLPRLSSESALGGSDFMSHLHGMGSPSPMPNRFPRRLREKASRALQPARRPSLEKLRTSFEKPSLSLGGGGGGGLFNPIQSPHPRNNIALETPSSRMAIGLETPMPKQVEDWGSRPILGKDWGESLGCCESTIDACSQILAKAWFTSEFYGNEALSTQYQMALDADDESSLFAHYDADVALDSDDDSEIASINCDTMDTFSTAEVTSKKIGFARCDSVGASALDLLHLDDTVNDFGQSPTYDRRRTMKLRKYARMSLCVAAASDFLQPKLKRCYRLSESPTKKSSLRGTPINNIVESSAFSHILSYLNEGELIHSASLVCTRWADEAAEALGSLMLISVGCDPSLNDMAVDDDSSLSEASGVADSKAASSVQSSVAKSMERGWSHLMDRFPWAHFLSDGAFKTVYKVWNHRCENYEALSVMDVNSIENTGNSNLVGTELAVSVLLSSLARRNICPNFVITRGVFTCQHEPPAALWGSREDTAPRGTSFGGRRQEVMKGHEPKPDQSGNYQYIRMELCQHGDVEGHIREQQSKQLAPCDCRNLLFQMVFALHVAGNKFGLKHYDVKLLNFLLQSAKDPTIADEDHPYVVLRYGVGSHVFRLRMHPSSAYIAKLADYGTSVMRTESDGQPVSLGQFTTLENTPPDFLILGNAAQQGYGHDLFGLGLCMLHLFTGHSPYEEILEDVVCPENLKGKLRKIWKQKSHDIIQGVMYDSDESGAEVEDQTLYDTLYRFLVLFGIPGKQFDTKKVGKVLRAINSTLLPTKGSRSKKCPDIDVFTKDCRKFSLAEGNDYRIADARRRLQSMDGAMELLLSLVSFDPSTRATPLEVINSRFMSDLIEDATVFYDENDIVKSYNAYLTNN